MPEVQGILSFGLPSGRRGGADGGRTRVRHPRGPQERSKWTRRSDLSDQAGGSSGWISLRRSEERPSRNGEVSTNKDSVRA